jgi:hypothetical protein
MQTFLIEPQGSGARVRWISEASFGWNPIGRIVGICQKIDVRGYYSTTYLRSENLDRTIQTADLPLLSAFNHRLLAPACVG